MSTKNHPSVEYLRQCFTYDGGRLFWLNRPREHFRCKQGWSLFNTKFAGKEAGSPSKKQCPACEIRFSQFGVLYRHHIVWALHKGEWPEMQIDHKNRNSLDDRIDNLRLSTQSQNLANATINSKNTSGFKGVNFSRKKQKWRARIKVKSKEIYLGLFDDILDAHAAYCEAAKRYFGEFACDGNPLTKGQS